MKLTQKTLRRIIREELQRESLYDMNPDDMDPESIEYMHAAVQESLESVVRKFVLFNPRDAKSARHLDLAVRFLNSVGEDYGERGSVEMAAVFDGAGAAVSEFLSVFRGANGDFGPHADELARTWSAMMEAIDASKAEVARAIESAVIS
jgi:hypothetical protein